MRISLLCLLLITTKTGFGQADFGSIKGHLNYTKDEPAKNFLVELKDPLQQTVKQTYTYDDGSFYFDSVATGTYFLVILYQGTLGNFERTDTYTKKIRVTKYVAEFVDITLVKEVIVERIICYYLPRRSLYLYPPLIDGDGRFNSIIVREDIR